MSLLCTHILEDYPGDAIHFSTTKSLNFTVCTDIGYKAISLIAKAFRYLELCLKSKGVAGCLQISEILVRSAKPGW